MSHQQHRPWRFAGEHHRLSNLQLCRAQPNMRRTNGGSEQSP
jgi:hypothetical protein